MDYVFEEINMQMFRNYFKGNLSLKCCDDKKKRMKWQICSVEEYRRTMKKGILNI